MAGEDDQNGLNILVTVKDAAYTEVTVRTAASILQATGGEATILMMAPNEQKRSNAQACLESLAPLIAPHPVRLLVRIGSTNEGIASEAVAGGYDLVIVGERPDNVLMKRLFPHSLERVIKELPTPVLVARHHSGPLRRFLVCEGGRSIRLLPAITGRLKPLMRTAEKIVILHVMSQMTASPGVPGWELRADATELIIKHTPEGERLEYDLSVISPLGVNVAVKVRHGIVVEEILAEADEGDYDVIVLGAPQVSGLQRYLVDDPIHKIIMMGERPVLVI